MQAHTNCFTVRAAYTTVSGQPGRLRCLVSSMWACRSVIYLPKSSGCHCCRCADMRRVSCETVILCMTCCWCVSPSLQEANGDENVALEKLLG